jgi:hypothetical protein
MRWLTANGGAVLAGIFLLGISARGRKRRVLLSLIVVLVNARQFHWLWRWGQQRRWRRNARQLHVHGDRLVHGNSWCQPACKYHRNRHDQLVRTKERYGSTLRAKIA